MSKLKTLKTIKPKEVWKFFKELGETRGAFLMMGKAELALEETDDLSEPPDVALDQTVQRKDWTVFLQVLVALQGGRPVKIVGHSKTLLRVYVGPKP